MRPPGRSRPFAFYTVVTDSITVNIQDASGCPVVLSDTTVLGPFTFTYGGTDPIWDTGGHEMSWDLNSDGDYTVAITWGSASSI